MVLHAIGICPCCTYRSGRKSRHLPDSLYKLHDAVAAYATELLRRRATAATTTTTAALAASTAAGAGAAAGCGNGDVKKTQKQKEQKDAVAPEEVKVDIQWEEMTDMRMQLVEALCVSLEELGTLDLDEAHEALFAVLLELVQALEREGDLMVEGPGKGSLVEQLGVRVEMVKRALGATKGWFLDETVDGWRDLGRLIAKDLIEVVIKVLGGEGVGVLELTVASLGGHKDLPAGHEGVGGT